MKNKNSILYALALILLLILAVTLFYDSKKEERTFKKYLVNIDTNKVNKIIIYKKKEKKNPVIVYKENDKWLVKIENGKTAPAQKESVNNIISQLLSIKSKSLAANDESKWGTFEVDTSATEVQVFEGNNKTLDIYIGKFTYDPKRRAMISYVRLADDKNVYTTSGFLSSYFNLSPNDFRNKQLASFNYKDVKQIDITFSDSINYSLIKNDKGKWTIDEKNTDSTKTIRYLQNIQRIFGSDFGEKDDISSFKSATAEINIILDNNTINIKAYKKDDKTIYLKSSQNNEIIKDNGTLYKRIFVLKNKFFNKKET